MRLLKFISLFYTVKLYFNYLPVGLQDELVDTMQDYKTMCIIAKNERS